ncbi:MAG: hypothetical protein A2W18_09810 [Candidatus Muproteobacteria bacterium RBG_16_60_9]|uniref:Uncharacterized protein n=1 Tax=Candidatus Muproteobacteria bacterium RBG_16_60_9 TaxID=1817755 RepID=A0A1F6VAE3_9PROT|nr:MAG: hypothetical protein A2W18_09810 [Candidatus Muproteobacteria bacterium RBG_16_60_9]
MAMWMQRSWGRSQGAMIACRSRRRKIAALTRSCFGVLCGVWDRAKTETPSPYAANFRFERPANEHWPTEPVPEN